MLQFWVFKSWVAERLWREQQCTVLNNYHCLTLWNSTSSLTPWLQRQSSYGTHTVSARQVGRIVRSNSSAHQRPLAVIRKVVCHETLAIFHDDISDRIVIFVLLYVCRVLYHTKNEVSASLGLIFYLSISRIGWSFFQ